MRKIAILAILLTNPINIANQTSEVTKIEHTSIQNTSSYFYLNINLKTLIRDIFKLEIYFHNQENKKANYYARSLIIEKEKETTVKIPYYVQEKIFLNIIISSQNLEKEIENIMFPIYPKVEKECNLNIERKCMSSFPTSVIYQNKKIKEEYSEISLLNKETNFQTFNNLLPIDKIYIKSNIILDDFIGYISLENKIDELEMYYDTQYLFPILANNSNQFLNLVLANKYYIDFLNGITSDTYKTNYQIRKEILFPYLDNKYSLTLQLNNLSLFSRVIFEFEIETKGVLIGDNGKYLIRRGYN